MLQPPSLPPVRLPVAVLRPVMLVASRWAFSPRVDWPTRRRRTDLVTMGLPGVRGTQVREVSLGGARTAELMPPGGGDDARLLYFHGGGYAVGSARSHRSLCAQLALGFGAAVLAVNYRLAPEHPHPAALHDARAAWSALLAEGRDPGRIAVVGDSAGGGLALALAQSLLSEGRPGPAAVGLISPWLDVSADTDGRRADAPRDVVLTLGLGRAFASAALNGSSPAAPSISPLLGRLDGLPPLIVHTAGEEQIRADGEQLVARARAAGVTVTDERLPGLWHDAHVTAAVMREPARSAPLRMAAGLRAHLDG